MKAQSKQAVAKSLQDLRRLLSESEDGMDEHVRAKLTLGDMWSIPDRVTKFGDKDKHPWLVIKGYSSRRHYIEISPRTTSFNVGDDGKRGLISPANVISELDKEGFILLSHRIKLTVDEFRDFVYLGKLPDTSIAKIEAYLIQSAKSSRK